MAHWQQRTSAFLPPDIRPELESALFTSLDFVGAFSFSQTYEDAPNPSLRIQGLGTIGVPLSNRDAEAIKSKAEKASFSHGMRANTIDRSTRDTWSIDAKMVTFVNSRWGSFMQTSVEQACKALGVNYVASRPRCEPYKLLLYETGSRTERADGTFATIIVVLPSEHTGGEARLSHNGVSVTYDSSQASLEATTVMGWYTNVVHEIKPIKSGYQLAISFNLIHTANSLPPAISTNSLFVGEVKRVLLSWKAMSGTFMPKKIVYLLNRRPSRTNIRGGALKGTDDMKVSLLHQVCKEVGFRLGTATVLCHLSDSVVDNRGDYYEERIWGYSAYDDDDDEEELENLEFLNIGERDVAMEGLVDMDGTVISTTLEIDEPTEAIPTDLSDGVEYEDHEEQDLDSDTGDGSGYLERWYRRTALVIWPEKSDYDIVYSNNDVEYACGKLQESPEPSEGSTRLAEYVLSRLAESPHKAIKSVCDAALRWKDYFLWYRAVGTHVWHEHVSLLGLRDLENAIKTFGFRQIGKCLEQAFIVAPSNKGPLVQIAALEKMMQDNSELEEACGKETIASWIYNQRDTALHNLKTLHDDDVKDVIRYSISHGGPVFLQECVVPQLVAQQDSMTLVKLALEIHKSTIQDASTKTEVMSELVITAVTKFDFFPAPKPTGVSPGSFPNTTIAADTSLEYFKRFIYLCCRLGCADAIVIVLEKVMPTTMLSPEDALTRARSVMLPLLDYIVVQTRAFPGTFPESSVKALAETTIPLILSQPNEMDGTLTRSLVNAVKMAGGGLDLIQTTVVPQILLSTASPEPQLVLAEEIMNLGASLPEGTEHEDFNAKVQSMIIPLTSNVARHRRLTPSILSDVLRRMGKLGSGRGCAMIIQRIISTVHQANATQVQQTFIPLLSPLRELALSNSELEPSFHTFQRTVVQRWVETILGQRTSLNHTSPVLLSRWPCTCTPCQKVKDFLQDSASADDPSLRLDCIGAQVRRHLEGFLYSCASRAVHFATTTGRSPSMFINLNPEMMQFLRSEKDRVAGIKILRDIATDEDQLQTILGDYYNIVLHALGVRRITPGVVTPSERNHGAVVSNSTHASAVVSGSTTQAQTDQTGEPPAKRRKIIPNSADVL